MIQGESLGQRAHPTLDAEDDDALLERLRAGEDAAFQALVDRHRPWLVRLCSRLLGHDVHGAEDAAQESLLKLHAAARRDGRPLRIRPWLTVVARNVCIDEQRRRRPDLPGELPEQQAPGDDPFHLDAALADAWPRLAGRHREVLYLREVLGFSYKEIGAVMGLTMPATETLVFRARAALRREYERSGGSAFGCGLFGFHLARLGLRRRRAVAVADGLSNAAVTDPGLGGLSTRLVQFLSALPGCGEQAAAKVLAVAAGMAMAAASVLPVLGPFAHTPAAAAVAPTVPSEQAVETPPLALHATSSTAPSAAPTRPVPLNTLLGQVVPASWTPHQARTSATSAGPATPSGAAAQTAPPRATPLRDAAAVARPADSPVLKRPARGESGSGPIESILPGTVDRPERPEHPVRSLLADPVPFPIDPEPTDPVAPDSLPAIPDTRPDSVAAVGEIVESAPPPAPAVGEVSGSLLTTTFADHEPAHL